MIKSWQFGRLIFLKVNDVWTLNWRGWGLYGVGSDWCFGGPGEESRVV